MRKYGLGDAPASGTWLVGKARPSGVSAELLETVGLIAKRDQGPGFYDRFRNRIQFPIRNVQGQTIAFGGRILPSSPFGRAGAEILQLVRNLSFSARARACTVSTRPGTLRRTRAFWRSWRDTPTSLMARRRALLPVVATMFSALNARHRPPAPPLRPARVAGLRRGRRRRRRRGQALAIFVGQGGRTSRSPRLAGGGMDPCDLLLAQERRRLPGRTRRRPVDAGWISRSITCWPTGGVGRGRRAGGSAMDSILGVHCLGPALARVRRELESRCSWILTRIAQRFHLKEETVWATLERIAAGARRRERTRARPAPREADDAERTAKARPEGRHSLEGAASRAGPGSGGQGRPPFG